MKFLILGYKIFGNGIEFYNSNKSEIDDNIQFWYMFISKYFGKYTMSFDNLAIEQLNIKRLFTKSGWDKFFMGKDFSHTMYIDAVNQEFSPTSRNSNRESFNDYSIQDYFQKFRTNLL